MNADFHQARFPRPTDNSVIQWSAKKVGKDRENVDLHRGTQWRNQSLVVCRWSLVKPNASNNRFHRSKAFDLSRERFTNDYRPTTSDFLPSLQAYSLPASLPAISSGPSSPSNPALPGTLRRRAFRMAISI